MGVKKFLRSVLGTSAEAALVSEADKAVAALKTTAIGKAVATDVKALSRSDLSGLEKFEQVVKNTAPLIVTLLTNDGRAAAIGDVTDVARALVQSTFNDIASKRAVSVGRTILSVLGIK